MVAMVADAKHSPRFDAPAHTPVSVQVNDPAAQPTRSHCVCYTPRMKKFLLLFGAVALVVLIGFFALNSYIYTEKQGDGGTVERYRGTLEGETVCLPHRNTDGPQTLECAIGMRTDAGEYYAVDFSLLSQERPPVETGVRLRANGLITPIEMLSTDQWNIYDIEGVFSVTDSVELPE